MGFNQKEIKNELDKIKKAADDFKNMTEEEKSKNSNTTTNNKVHQLTR